MTDDDVQYRQHYQADPDDVSVREDSDEGMFAVQMPIASTGEVRNEGDDPLDRDALEGMAQQLESRQIGAFPSHGDDTMIAGSRYSPFEKLGYWSGGDVQERAADDGEDILMAEARMPDPETLPDTTGRYREGLSILKEQADRGIALSSSIGWREDDDAPGGNDLMEASIVGIPADPRTDSVQSGTTEVLARAAVEAGADAEAFVETVRDVVMGSNDDQGSDARDTVTDDSDTSDEQSEDENRDEQNGTDDAEEFREFMRDQTETQTEILRTLADTIREDDEDEESDDDDEEEDESEEENESDDGEDEDEDEDEQSSEPSETQSIDVDGRAVSADDVRELRQAARDADVEVPENLRSDDTDEQDDDEEQSRSNDEEPAEGPDWRA